MLSRIFDLRVELHQRGSNFVTAIAYLSVIFALLIKLSVGMQGTIVTILEAAEKLQAFQINLSSGQLVLKIRYIF